MFRLYFNIGESIPNITDWIQAVAVVLTTIIAWRAYGQWKKKEFFDLRREGIRNKEKAVAILSHMLYADSIKVELNKDDQRKYDAIKAISNDFAQQYFLLIRFRQCMDIIKSDREELIKYANQTQLLPKTDKVRQFYEKFLEFNNDIPTKITRYLNDELYDFHELHVIENPLERIVSKEVHLDDKEFYNSIFNKPHFGRGAILDEILYYNKKVNDFKI